MPPTQPTDDAAKKVRALAKLADDLRGGASFEITKLTVLKGLCAERQPKTHNPMEYRALSEPILLELQQREQEILDYLSQAEEPTPSRPGVS
jgi:hypothetical protein